jgi:hypothetical protein
MAMADAHIIECIAYREVFLVLDILLEDTEAI